MAAWARNLFSIIILMKARRLTLCHTYSWCPKTSFREHRAIAAFPLSQTTSTEFNLLLCCCFNYQVCDKTRIGISNRRKWFLLTEGQGEKKKKKETNKQNPAFFEKQLGEETQYRACQSRFFFSSMDTQVQIFTLKNQIQKCWVSHCFHQTSKCKQPLIAPLLLTTTPLHFNSKFQAYLASVR